MTVSAVYYGRYITMDDIYFLPIQKYVFLPYDRLGNCKLGRFLLNSLHILFKYTYVHTRNLVL